MSFTGAGPAQGARLQPEKCSWTYPFVGALGTLGIPGESPFNSKSLPADAISTASPTGCEALTRKMFLDPPLCSCPNIIFACPCCLGAPANSEVMHNEEDQMGRTLQLGDAKVCNGPQKLDTKMAFS